MILLPNGSFGSHPAVKLFMKGVFNLRPTVPRYRSTWDPEDVLDVLRLWEPVAALPLKELSMKTLTLMLLATSARGATLHALDISRMSIDREEITFHLTHLDVKQGRKGVATRPLVIKRLRADKAVCPWRLLVKYLSRIRPLRGDEKALFLTTCKPHGPAARDTMRRWVRETLLECGVDTAIFKAGSTRSASASAATRAGMPLEEVMAMGGWTRPSTFQRFYNRPL